MPNKTFRRAALILITLLVNAGGAGALAAPAPQAGAPAFRPIVVMSWNIHGGNRPGTPKNQNCDIFPKKDHDLDPVRRWVDTYNVDVAAFQEIHRFQAEAMAETLRKLDARYKAQFFSHKICKPSNRGMDYGSAIISRLPVVKDTTINKLFKDQVPQKTERPEYVSIDGYVIQTGTEQVRIYNVHTSGEEPYRQRQLSELRSVIYPPNVNARTVRPRTILMGDFNMPYDTRTGSAYMSMRGLFLDSWLSLHPARPQNGITMPGRGLRLDYIFLGDRRLDQPGIQTGFNIEFSRILQTGNVSDHLPVVARLHFAN